MNPFETLFGLKPTQIQKNCILTPYLTKNLLKSFGINTLHKGLLYASGNGPYFSLIRTGIGAPFVGDAVLYLNETPCQNIFFLGSCGLIQSTKKLSIGSLVSPSSCLGVESFSEILQRQFQLIKKYCPNKTLLKEFLKLNISNNLQSVPCASFGSLKLEEDNLNFFEGNVIQAVDMECSAFFNASSKIKRRALALLYVTDIINEKPFYKKRVSSDNAAINAAIQKSIKILSDFLVTLG